MIARHETHVDKTDIWSKLAASLPAGVISWRQDGRPSPRDGRFFARFVAYIEANTVRERLDSVVPGEWDLTLELLPALPGGDGDASCSFKARLQILGVIREDVGTGKDYKQAATDAFKRAAVRFGIGHELYAYEQNWVQVDGDGKYARPLEDPQTAYDRRFVLTQDAPGKPAPMSRAEREAQSSPEVVAAPEVLVADAPSDAGGREPLGVESADNPSCPKCAGKMWDNRATKRNPKAPDFKCRDRSCDGVIWPTKLAAVAGNGRAAPSPAVEPELVLDRSPLGRGVDDIPF